METKENLVIYKTKDLTKFKHHQKNRDIVKGHVNKIYNRIKAEGFNKENFIVVNERYQIIDGQHRFQALKKIYDEGKEPPFYYYIKEGADIRDIISMNTIARNWNMKNLIVSKSKGQGIDSRIFKMIVKFMDITTNIGLTALISAINSFKHNDTDILPNTLDSMDEYNDTSLLQVEAKMLDFIKLMNIYFGNVNIGGRFINAMAQLYNSQEKPRELFSEFSNKYEGDLRKDHTREDWFRIVEDTLNKGKLEKNRIRIY